MGLKVDTIQNPSSATVNLTLDTSGNVTAGANQTVTGNLTVNGTTALTGAVTQTGSSTAASFVPTGSTVPANGMYLSAANTLNFATASANRASISSAGIFSCLLTDLQSANGYTKLPNGIYIQWGTTTASTVGVTTSFPIAFPTACWGVIGTNTNQTNPPSPSISYTRTNFTATVSSGSPTVSWFAIGN